MRKGFATKGDVEEFLRPRLKSLSDPFLLPQIEMAVVRILAALDRHERVVLFGDYDVDGVTSLALLAEMWRAYGNALELFLPLRMEEGYGLSYESVERCLEEHHPQLLIAIDCGTSSVEEIAVLRKALAMNPKDGHGYYYLGNVLASKNRDEEAFHQSVVNALAQEIRQPVENVRIVYESEFARLKSRAKCIGTLKK